MPVRPAQQLQDVGPQVAGVRRDRRGDQLPVGGDAERGAVGPPPVDRVLVRAGPRGYPAAAGIVTVFDDRRGRAYPDMAQEPKLAFAALAEGYRPAR